MLVVFRNYPRALVIGTLVPLAIFVLFYLMTVFALSLGHHGARLRPREISRDAVVGYRVVRIDDTDQARCWPNEGVVAHFLWVTSAIGVFGLVMAPMFLAGTIGAVIMMTVGLSLMGLTYGPLGTALSELFPYFGALLPAAR